MRLRTFLATLAVTAVPVSSAQAVVGGSPVAAGKDQFVAEITIDDAFLCTGTLVTPTYVVTAGHCSSITGATGDGIPIGQPGQLITVTLGSNKPRQVQAFAVKNVTVTPNDNCRLPGSGDRPRLLQPSRPARLPTVKIAGKGEEG